MLLICCMMCLLGEVTSRQSVVDDDSEDKVSEDVLKKLGLL